MQVEEKIYREISISLPSDVSDIVCEILRDNYTVEGIVTSEEKYKNLELVCADETIKAYVTDKNLDIEEIKQFFHDKKQIFEDCGLIEETDTDWQISVKVIENQDWSANWKKYWKPLKISERIVICPTWEKYETKDNEIKIELDPAHAFGTGTHATTQLCVLAMEKYMQKDSNIADIGTGSGILSICARKLGAKTALGIDIDETILDTATLNAKVNKVDNIEFQICDISILKSENYDFVCANILHNVLAQIMTNLKRITKTNGFISLSGILKGKEPSVLEAVKENHLSLIDTIEQGDWISFVVKKEK